MSGLRVELVRSGGLANLMTHRSLDSDQLPPAEAAEVDALVSRIDLDGLAARSPIRGRGADRYQYDLTVSRGAAVHQFSIAEGEVPPELRALLDRLMA